MQKQIADLEKRLISLKAQRDQLDADIAIARKTVEQLHDESTAELEANITNIEEINRKVRANMDKDKAEMDAQEYINQYNALTVKLEEVRQAKIDLLKGADLPAGVSPSWMVS